MLVTSLCIQTSFGEGFPFGIKKVTTLKRMNNAKNSRYRVPKKSVAFSAGTKKNPRPIFITSATMFNTVFKIVLFLHNKKYRKLK